MKEGFNVKVDRSHSWQTYGLFFYLNKCGERERDLTISLKT